MIYLNKQIEKKNRENLIHISITNYLLTKRFMKKYY